MIIFFARCFRKINRIRRKIIFFFIILNQYKKLKSEKYPRFELRWRDRWLQLRDATSTTTFDKHYIFHTAWASRILKETSPIHHVDVSSSLYFVTSISAFIPTTFIDLRPAILELSGLESLSGNLLNLPFSDNSLMSISSMHVVEHIGLGRYGDNLDYDGDLKACTELSRVLAQNGQLLFVVPISGRARIEFNAHRIYTYEQILKLFNGLVLKEFSLILDDGSDKGLVRNATAELALKQNYACGCFLFVKHDT